MRKYAEVSVEVDLEDFEDDDLISELQSRGYSVGEEFKADESLEVLYELKKLQKNAEFEAKFAEYVWETIGKLL